MTGNTRNPFELLVQQVHKGQNCTNKLPVRKIYIDEDPAKEQMVPCPRCLDRDQQNMVRYLFINLNEAIYKCEAYDCMYPFRDFKFKNFEESSVYRYELQSSHQHDFDANFGKIFPTSCNNYENPMEHIASIDFNVDFLSYDGVDDKQPHFSSDASEPPVFAQTARTSDPATNFDTGFIDEILEDLFPASSNIVPSTMEAAEVKEVSSRTISTGLANNHSSCKPATPASSSSGRKLEKCLKIFEKSFKASEDDVFKKPKSPVKNSLVVEHISPTRLKIKRVPEVSGKPHNTTDAGKHRERIAKVLPLDVVGSNGTLKSKQARSLVKNKKLKPLDLVCKLNTMNQQKEATPCSTALCQQPTTVRFSSAKVQKMLSFIQRSMKTSGETEGNPPKTVTHAEGDDDRSRTSNIKIEPPSHPSTISTPMQNAEIYTTGNSTEDQMDKKYSSEAPTGSASGGMEVLFHFMQS
ncbi:uncharacterized protein LOC126567326 [Anopheles maculipalpis]|uniref:uncharacterized protein LOC126567326 n=1 Tax=Anopheles maculipalpis TaxID=1496333 RepID=UPI0021596DD7|nr:uncharacterized protein LOC126567326 [Anopheles maculipalpis]